MDENQELNWQLAEEHLKRTEEAYRELIGMPNVNPWFAIGIVAAARIRFDNGERTQELYDAIMELN